MKNIIIGSLAFSILALSSCRKDELFTAEILQTASNNSMAELYDNDVQNMVDEVAVSGSLQTYKMDEEATLLSSCATVSRDTVSFPRMVTIDFGTVNCTGNDGRMRRGKIIATYTGAYRDAGTVVSITYDNYFVNDAQVSGSRTVTNTGTDSLGFPQFDVQASIQIDLPNGGGTISRNSSRTRSWIAGSATSIRTDDVYSITGTATGINASGNAYTVLVIEPLIRNLACRRHFTQGIMQIDVAGRPSRRLDYGNGSCDDQALLTVNGRTRTINLP